ncbi:MAG: TIGR03435 family protein [Acidobacteriaceae bacterium]
MSRVGLLAITLTMLLPGAARDTNTHVGALFLACCLAPASAQSAPVSASLPAFEVATIRPPDPRARFRPAGFYGKPGGRVFFGGTIKMLVEDAFDLRGYQVAGGPEWTASQWFEINAIPPEGSPSRNIKVANVEPTSEQRLMLQRLLRDRLGFKFHFETKEGKVYILTRGRKPLQLKPPKDPAADPRAIVMMKGGDLADGEAEGTNTTTDYLAIRLSRYLQLPVLNETGIAGSYDYYLPPDDPENHDLVAAVFDVVDRLGLKIKRGRGPVRTIVIDHVEPPSEN